MSIIALYIAEGRELPPMNADDLMIDVYNGGLILPSIFIVDGHVGGMQEKIASKSEELFDDRNLIMDIWHGYSVTSFTADIIINTLGPTTDWALRKRVLTGRFDDVRGTMTRPIPGQFNSIKVVAQLEKYISDIIF